MTSRQKKILSHFVKNAELTSMEAVVIIGNDYYCNQAFHTCAFLSRMVKSGLLVRVRRGVYRRGEIKINTGQPESVDPNQTKLF